MLNKSLYWVRNDQRIKDNETLIAALEQSHSLALVVFPTDSARRAGSARQLFLETSYDDFDRQLQRNGHRLQVAPFSVLQLDKSFFEHNQITAVFFSEEPTFEETEEENHVRRLAEALGIKIFSFQQDTLIKVIDLPFSISELPKPFTSFRHKVETHMEVRHPITPPARWCAPLTLHNTSHFSTTSTSLPINFIGGETKAQQHIQNYFHKNTYASTYKETRNGMIKWQDSTKLSPWLSLGNISPRQIYFEIKDYEKREGANDSTYWIVFELLWRDYFRFYARQKKQALFGEKKLYLSHIDENLLFARWCLGETGEAFIDANMRQLLLTGWMSNRGRQNVASYLAKQLQLPWVWGAQWFEKMLVDYDAANNWGNWNYFSGRDLDPRNRAFNIQTQVKTYDPDGQYQNYWLSPARLTSIATYDKIF